MTTILDVSVRPLDPRQEGVQRRLITDWSPEDHFDLVTRLGCNHEAISHHYGTGRTFYHWCDDCRAQRERELAEAGR
jgi:hypothetical protein